MAKPKPNREKIFCKVCGKSAAEDIHFFIGAQLCNRHWLQMRRHGKILSIEPLHVPRKNVCDLCGETNSPQFTYWRGEDEYKGMTLCAKHYWQLKNHGKIVDPAPVLRIAKEDKICCECGTTDDILIHKGKMYCRRCYHRIVAREKNGGKPKVYWKNVYETEGDVTKLFVYNTSHDLVGAVLLDTEDVELVRQYKWSISKWGYAQAAFYAEEKHRAIFMQTLVWGKTKKGEIIDHINRDPLDNRKENLRVSDKKKNAYNSKVPSSNKTGVKGVCFDNNRKLYRAFINYDGKRIELGYYDNFDEAVKVRLRAEKKLHGEFASQKHLYAQYGIEDILPEEDESK